jgi:hypothetical protein
MDNMNLEENIINTGTPNEVPDNSGLAEIQQAMDEIEKLKNQDYEEEEKSEEPEEKVENDKEEESSSPKKEKEADQLWKMKKSKYRALAEKEALAQENIQLKQMLSESLNSGTYHYGKSAYAHLERAKESKKKAIEAGDIDELIESDIALTKAINTVNDLEKWVYTEEQKKSQVPEYTEQQQYTGYNEVQQEMAHDWLDNHSYLQPSSPNYNQKLANQVAGFINNLDANLAENGEMDAFFSKPYFEQIEKYISSIPNEAQKTTKNLESAGHVGGVRNSYSSSVNGKVSSPTQMILTADEKRMCANADISEKEWLRYKLEDLKKGK